MRRWFLLVVCLGLAGSSGSEAASHKGRPNVLVVTIDTLRVDAMSAYGASRPTTPHLDARMAGGVRFELARTVEPLTTPALASTLTCLSPRTESPIPGCFP